VAGEGDLLGAGEDSDLGGAGGVFQRQDEGGFGVVELGRHLQHLRIAHPARVQDHGKRVAAETRLGEDVDRNVVERGHVEDRSGSLPSR